MPESRSTPTPRGTLRALRREALTLRHLNDEQAREHLAWGPPHLVDQALARRRIVLARGFLDREPSAAAFERRAHRAHFGLTEAETRGAA